MVLFSALPSLQAEETEIAQQGVRVSLFLSPEVFDPGIRELDKFMRTLAEKVRPPRATGHCCNLPGKTCLSSSEGRRREDDFMSKRSAGLFTRDTLHCPRRWLQCVPCLIQRSLPQSPWAQVYRNLSSTSNLLVPCPFWSMEALYRPTPCSQARPRDNSGPGESV